MPPRRDKSPVERQNIGTSLQPRAAPEARNGNTTPLHSSSSSDDAGTTVPQTPDASTATPPRLEQPATPSSSQGREDEEDNVNSSRRHRTIPRSHPREESSNPSDPTLSSQGRETETPGSSQSTRADSEEIDQFFDDGSDTGPAMRSSRRASQHNHNTNTPSIVSSCSSSQEMSSSSQLTGDEPTSSPADSRGSSVEPGEMEASAKRGRSLSGTSTPRESKRFKH